MITDFGLPAFWLLVKATRWTIYLSLIAFVAGGMAGFIVALLRTSRSAIVRNIVAVYIQIIQGTPVLILLFMAFYGLALFGIRLGPLVAATIALMVYSSAYLGEIWRGCIEAIPRAQWEASESLAFTRWQVLRHVILPQAFRISLPPTVGFLVQLIKQTSVASLISLIELTRSAQLISNATFEPLKTYLAAAAIYFVICFVLSRYSQTLERRLNVSR
ncbi:MAG TPA: amino acid ABC transporter permease [Trueperaceae bacterium]